MHLLGVALHELLDRQQQHGLGEAALVEAILGVAVGRDGQDDLTVAEESADGFERLYALLCRERAFHEFALRPLVAVAYG